MASIAQLFNRICQPIWDTQVVIAGSQVLRFFAVPVGQGLSAFDPAAASAKTYADTNLEVAGMLPQGFSYDLMQFRFQLPADVVQADAQAVFNGAVLEFWVSTKPFLRVPVSCVPAGNGLYAGSLPAAGAAVINNGNPSSANAFIISTEPIHLEPTENFYALLTWPSTPVAAVTQTGYNPDPGLPVRLYLDGYQNRPTQ